MNARWKIFVVQMLTASTLREDILARAEMDLFCLLMVLGMDQFVKVGEVFLFA